MRSTVTKKIAYSELMIVAVIYSTLIPYILISMHFTNLQLFHYMIVMMLLLTPLAIAMSFYFIDHREVRPIEMLSFYLERRLDPPADIMAAARVRTLNLPLVHAMTVLVRYELVTLLNCLYMGTIGGLPFKETVRLGLITGIGLAVFPIFSFFLTERLLAPLRQILAEKTGAIRVDETGVIRINTRTRLLSILLATVIAPLLALGALVYRRTGLELAARLGDLSPVQPVMSQMFHVISAVTIVAFVLAAIIGVLLAMSISDPLGRMVKVIRELEKGNLKARANLISNDELGVLSGSFDKMALQLEINRRELEDLNRNLEHRVAEKTERLTKAYEHLKIANQDLAIANRNYEEANRKLREIDRAKSDFISVVSHELRTPLTSIKAFTELMLMKPGMTAERKNRMLHVINNESDRLSRLINDILDLTRIEAGKLTWDVIELTIDDVIETSVSGIRSLADNKGLTINKHIRRPLPALFGDRDRLIQVMTNILSNSIKFTPRGGTIEVTALLEESPGPRILVRVSDTGIGIQESDLELVFEKFLRSGDILTNPTEGTGLGLTITRHIVEAHGGTIWMNSKLGKGCTVTFTIPLDKQWRREGRQTTFARL